MPAEERHTVYVDVIYTQRAVRIMEAFTRVGECLVDLREDLPWRAAEIDEAGEELAYLIEQLRGVSQ